MAGIPGVGTGRIILFFELFFIFAACGSALTQEMRVPERGGGELKKKKLSIIHLSACPYSGASVEHNKFCVSVHYRQCREEVGLQRGCGCGGVDHTLDIYISFIPGWFPHQGVCSRLIFLGKRLIFWVLST